GLPTEVIGSESSLDDSLCTVTAALSGPLAIEDARTDARVRDLPPVVGGQVVAYLGIPLTTHEGRVVGGGDHGRLGGRCCENRAS
ncbi:MAG TPA: hypothetical protein VFZ12_05285, partial [Dehalococcoidia bacterium]|nr:hypothetical protein [Dehalococcoidia bacterium]